MITLGCLWIQGVIYGRNTWNLLQLRAVVDDAHHVPNFQVAILVAQIQVKALFLLIYAIIVVHIR